MPENRPLTGAEKQHNFRQSMKASGFKEIRGMYATDAEKTELRKKYNQIKSRRKTNK